MNWRIAESLLKLRTQINDAYPNRSRISDGAIGDAKHASRKSDHNPWVKDSKGQPIVTAVDITHDPVNGVDCNQLAEWLRDSRDPRIKYVIWNYQIFSSKVSPWIWRKYSGPNKHTQHLHISVDQRQSLFDSVKEWDLDIALSGLSVKEIDQAVNKIAPVPVLKFGSKGEGVSVLQEKLFQLNLLIKGEIDGDFGPKTEAAVKSFQRAHSLSIDGAVGPATRAALDKALIERGTKKESAVKTGNLSENHPAQAPSETAIAQTPITPADEVSGELLSVEKAGFGLSDVSSMVSSTIEKTGDAIAKVQRGAEVAGQAASTVSTVQSAVSSTKDVLKGMRPGDVAKKVTTGKTTSFWANLFGGAMAFITAIWGFLTNNAQLIALGLFCVILTGVVIAVTFTVINHFKMKYASDPEKFNVE